MEVVEEGLMEMEDEEEVQEEMAEISSDSEDDSENEREEHYALERRVVEIRKEVKLDLNYVCLSGVDILACLPS